jgi:hypothetical protein
MASEIFDGLALVDRVGATILATTVASLALSVGANVFLRARYASLRQDLRSGEGSGGPFVHPVLNRIVRDAEQAARRSTEVNTQAIIEERFQTDLAPLLLAERFVKAATGLVIVLGLLGTFYGLTLSVGRLVHLVAFDAGQARDVAETVTTGLTHALMGMAVAFSNSLLGIFSAVVLTIVGVLSNVTERRLALVIELETFLDRTSAARAPDHGATTFEGAIAQLGASVARLDVAAQRLESAFQALSATTRDFKQFTVQIVANSPRDRG